MSALSREAIEQIAGNLLCRLVGLSWRSGWTPLDLHEVARRRLGADEAQLVVAVIAEESAAYPTSAKLFGWTGERRMSVPNATAGQQGAPPPISPSWTSIRGSPARASRPSAAHHWRRFWSDSDGERLQ